MLAGNFLGGLTPSSIDSFFKGTGILGAVGLILFLMIRHKVVRFVSVDRGTEWIRAKWGAEQYYRFGKRRGRIVRLKAGRHLLIRGIYDGWEICTREIPLVVPSLTQPFRGRMLQFDRLTISYEVIAPDSVEGDKLMLRSFLSVRNTDRDNQKSESLDDKVISITLWGLQRLLENTGADKYDLPVMSEKGLINIVKKRLRKRHGVRLTSVEWSAPTWMHGQQLYDAGYLIALALGYTPALSSVKAGDVLELPSHPNSA